MNSNPQHSISISTDPEAMVIIFDGYDRIIYQGFGDTRECHLAAGLYTVRAEMAGQHVQKMISVPRDREVTLNPRIYSPVPLAGAATTYDYYIEPAHTWSVKSTVPLASFSDTGWLFIFLRLSSQDAETKDDLAEGLSLHDETGKLLFHLGEQRVSERNNQRGWVAFSAPMMPGFYRLRYENGHKRESCLYVYPGLSTQVFINHFHRPRLEQMRVFLNKVNEPFDPSSPEVRSVDLALLGLQNGIAAISETLPNIERQNLLKGEFSGPMLGLIGAHWLVEHPFAEAAAIQQILAELRRRFGPMPDIIALEVAASMRFRELPVPNEVVVTPPMIRHGVELIVKERPNLIPEDGLFESMLTNMYLDSPWTSWRIPSSGSERVHESEVKDLPLDWLESAVLAAGIRGEFNEEKTEPIGKHLIVTPSAVKQAYARLALKLQDKTPSLYFNESYVVGSPPLPARLYVEKWPLRGAAVFNEPMPPLGFPHDEATILARNVRLRTGSLDVGFRGESQVKFGSWAQVLADFEARFTGLTGALGKRSAQGAMFFGLLNSYDDETPRGAIALDALGPSSKPSALTYGLISEGKPWRGFYDSLQSMLRDFGLPRQFVGTSDKSDHETVLLANVEGSFDLAFKAAVMFRYLHVPRAPEGWISTACVHPFNALGTVTASGAFQVSLSRVKQNIYRFSLHHFAPSANTLICLSSFRVEPREWQQWAQLEITEAAASRINLGEILDQPSDLEPIARVLGTKYASELRRLIEQGVSGRPLLELEIQGTEQAEILNQAIDGKFNLSDSPNAVNLSGTLMDLVKPRQQDVIVGLGTPDAVWDQTDRIIAYQKHETIVRTLAHIDALSTDSSSLSELSSPSATLVSGFVHASPDLLRILFSNIVDRWLPDEKGEWPSLTESIGRQAGLNQWNAIVQLKLQWTIDLRKAGKDLEPDRDDIYSAIRRELRLLVPFYFFVGVDVFSQMDSAIPILVYQSLPGDISSADGLAMNGDIYGGVNDVISGLRFALEKLGKNISPYEWNVPYWLESFSGPLQAILSWETSLCNEIFRGLRAAYRSPSARTREFDIVLSNIVDKLSSLFPLFAGNTRAISAVRTAIFTTALSVLASSSAKVSAEMSINAIGPDTQLRPDWIAAPDSVPLAVLVGHGRISATTESATPLRQRAVAAVG